MSENSNSANPHESFKQLVDYIKLIVTLTVSWLGIISAMFFFFLWQDRQAAKDAISKIKEEATISIKKVETKTLTKLDSINDAVDKEVREKVNRYFEKEDIEALVEAKFKKLVTPKVENLVKKRGDEMFVRMDRRSQFDFDLNLLNINRTDGIKRLHLAIKNPTIPKEDKKYIISKTKEIIGELLGAENGLQKMQETEKQKFREGFKDIYDRYDSYWENMDTFSPSLRSFLKLHYNLNRFFETEFTILEGDKLLIKCKKYLKQEEYNK